MDININAKEIFNKYHWSGEGDYSFVGIRVQDVPFELGEIDHVSHVWEDGVDTGEELDGICAIDLRYYEESSSYSGDHVAIIVSDDAMGGEDFGELVMENAKVVEILA